MICHGAKAVQSYNHSSMAADDATGSTARLVGGEHLDKGGKIVLAVPHLSCFLQCRFHRILKDEIRSESLCHGMNRLVRPHPGVYRCLGVFRSSISDRFRETALFARNDRIGLHGLVDVDVDRYASLATDGESVHVSDE